MGNIGQKCSCFNSKKPEFEDQVNIDQRTKPSSKNGSEGNRIEKEFMIKNMLVNNKIGRNENLSNLQSINSFDFPKENIDKVIRLQSILRGFYFRIKYKLKLKQRLEANTRSLVEKYKNEFKTATLYRAEALRGPFNPNGWTKYYSFDSSYLFNYEQKYYGSEILKSEILIFNETSYYIGTVNVRNQRCGFGVFVNIDGEKFEGNWVLNKFTGWGRYIDIEGSVYEGYFLNNTLNGKGEKHTLSGSSYVGEFKNNLKHGKGKEETVEHTYVGDFKKDKREGTGKLTYKNTNDCYEGEFIDNRIIGTGFYTWENGDTFEGTFLNGKMHGRGIYRWPDGGEYEGEYVDNIKEGFGIFKWTNGKIFKGTFHDGKPHGKGIMLIEKEIFDVVFEDGKLMSSVKSENVYKTKDRDTLSFREKDKLRSTMSMKLVPSPTSTSTGVASKKTVVSSKNELYKK